MEKLIIEKTKIMPEIRFFENGNLSIEGRSYNEDPVKFYHPLIEWCKNLKAPSVKLEIKVDFMNTASSKCVFEIIKSLDLNFYLENLDIVWYYEMDDDDMFDLAQTYEDGCTKANFSYLIMEETFC